jgi:UDP-N-acetylmuramoyl-tripeptide--D-alanyl-D-alanine ligase
MTKSFKKALVTVLIWESKMVLRRYRPKIIAITGSVGKTSTKDAIFTILSKFKTVRKSDKSFNGEIGLPLTILGLPNAWNNTWMWAENIIKGFFMIVFRRSYPEWLVLEVGVGKPGDMQMLAPWLKPDIVVITRFPDKPVHVEFFSSPEKIIEEKSILAHYVKKDGVLVLNHDDEKVYALHNKAVSKTVSYGFHENATYHATFPSYLYNKHHEMIIPLGINFKLEYGGNTFPVNVPHVVGMHYVGQALAALAVTNEIGCDLLLSINALAEYIPPPGRLSLIEGINNSILIDDTYNSSPVAMEAAIEVLKEIKGMRKIAVVGDMLELGKHTVEAHTEIGEKLYEIADIIITVGPRAKFVGEGAISKGFTKKKIHNFDTWEPTARFLEKNIEKGDIVLLKGSQGVRLERVVGAIMAHPELKSKLLCRQDKEWEKRK